ncbi:histidine kinase dimerization/phosphoacceptor domain -containing protein [Mucilaginibacter aquaedulcis]|uniref:histidine kinase dimerization/phosphoacceptor domain -containing protein n=1 Tax=Mucilaginibacter aquaedulcis TaxID=1187081 RepID=UPI0025B323C8|nr:histidine kinase dimerization/phosphoacceptor domain -containing protein [Mucilaginibacter aquaedulcis]MDN3548879.1 histidine kinase dimerization/phosphoacceptor domain -containing protein [Mucilaginibacter aquaedulcis]
MRTENNVPCLIKNETIIPIYCAHVQIILIVTCLLIAAGLLYQMWINERNSRLLVLRRREQVRSKNRKIEDLLSEKYDLLIKKELLLGKVHHRVKNNMQLVLSLMSTQLGYIHDPIIKSALRDSQIRLQVMLLAYKRFYGKEDIQMVDMFLFMEELAIVISENYQDGGYNVSILVDKTALRLDITQADIVGLIINELIRYAISCHFSIFRDISFRVGLLKIDDVNLRLVLTYPNELIRLPPEGGGEEVQTRIGLLYALCEKLKVEPLIEQSEEMEISLIIKYLSYQCV